MIKEKKCKKCGKKKHISHFRKRIFLSGREKRGETCDDCLAEKQKERRASFFEYADAMPI